MREQALIAALKDNPFVLAPMAGITDRPFRSFMRSLGCGAVVTELVSATGLKYSSAKTRRLMEFSADQHPVGIQLFGENPDHLADAAQVVEQTGADFVDLNFGCPVPKVVSKGAGSACLKDLVRLRTLVRSARRAVSIPVTIKVRTGWDQATRNTHEVARLAHDEGVAWVAIHGRTRAAAYTGSADWDYIREVKSASPVPILGNGDLVTPERAVERLRATGCDGVMIGRGCLKNPRLFLQARRLWSIGDAGREEATFLEQGGMADILDRLHGHLRDFYDERMTMIQMRKFASWYSAGYPGAAALRKDVFRITENASALSRIRDFFTSVSESPADTSDEPFLMGGHG